MSILKIEDLRFQYRSDVVFDHAFLNIDFPHIYGLVAPNGSGKTTLFRLITGLIKQRSGSILINDKSNTSDNVFHSVAYFEDANSLSGLMRGQDYIDLVTSAHHLTKERVSIVLKELNISSFVHDKIRTYSMGMRQRLQISLLLLPDLPIVLFDEPLNGLDPTSLETVQRTIKWLESQGKTIFVSTHNLAELSQITDQVIFIDKQQLFLSSFKNYQQLKAGYHQIGT